MVEMCGPLAFILGLSISYVVDRFLDRVLLEQVRGRALENSPSASWSAFILRFSQVINSLMYGHVHATKNIPRESGLRPSGPIIFPS